jgi:hypothetical protein
VIINVDRGQPYFIWECGLRRAARLDALQLWRLAPSWGGMQVEAANPRDTPAGLGQTAVRRRIRGAQSESQWRRTLMIKDLRIDESTYGEN